MKQLQGGASYKSLGTSALCLMSYPGSLKQISPYLNEDVIIADCDAL
jgi:hypothetical protein